MTADRCSAETGRAALTEARTWLGTPYRHQASAKGAGADCLGLVRGVWRALYGVEPARVPPYTADWVDVRGASLVEAAQRHLAPVSAADARAGDVLLFRMRDRGPAKHLAILSSSNLSVGRMIHAYSGHAVCETHVSRPWRRRLVGVFRFPFPAEGHR